ncbi:MAG: hypothetical protein R2722_14050 [Tessaracoccus sp.]
MRDKGIVDFAPAEINLTFEQIGSLADLDLILYNATLDGQPENDMATLLDENAWKELPAVQSGHAQPVYCPWSKNYGILLQYLDGLDKALTTLPKPE